MGIDGDARHTFWHGILAVGRKASGIAISASMMIFRRVTGRLTPFR